mmetsp:Transcript_48940/g.60156  ORF Transcript_48940/g.60156 Transcript_48940/m.60156 type:complete len:508 (-) Transcript_48940:92-1615(-)
MSFLVGLITIIIVLYILYQLFVKFLIYQENVSWDMAPKYPTNNHDEMVSIAKLKKDHEMSDDEFNLKYGAFRHELYRAARFSRKTLEYFNKLFHFIEVYILHGGPTKLKNSIPIDRPIFIIGDFRSGTSVLERLIEHHPDVQSFRMHHTICWSGPYIFESLLNWMGNIRENICKHTAWNGMNGKGIYWPHSSNVLLNRSRPFECENLWESCTKHMRINRNNNWDTLDDIKLNNDNNSNHDYITEEFSDPKFEELFKNTIRLVLSYQNGKRFILKNPMNGFRVRYLYKLFPNAKFIHISRNPLKTAFSQYVMSKTNLRVLFLDEKECRTNNNKPPKKSGKNTWNYLTKNNYWNEYAGTLWWPRIYPRTIPEYSQITKHLKNEKYYCAAAQAVAQHERVVLESWDILRQKGYIKDNKNLLTIWHEDLLHDASSVYKKVMEYLELDTTPEQRLKYLELEDFPNGQANKKRVNKSKTQENKGIKFGDETDEVNAILSKAMKRYQSSCQTRK